MILSGYLAIAQVEGNVRQRKISWPESPVQLDSMVVAPSTLVIISKDTLRIEEYRLSPLGELEIKLPKSQDSLHIRYRVLPIPYLQVISRKDTSIIRDQFEYEDPFAYRPSTRDNAKSVFDLGGFEKRGSISRGV